VSAHAQNYTFTTLNDRGLGGNPTAINDAGQVLGNSDFGGFIYSDGVFSYPSAIGELYAAGINNYGVISGTIDTSNDGNIGSIVNGSSVTTFSVPGSNRTLAYQINEVVL
jgi:hypothetical protein